MATTRSSTKPAAMAAEEDRRDPLLFRCEDGQRCQRAEGEGHSEKIRPGRQGQSRFEALFPEERCGWNFPRMSEREDGKGKGDQHAEYGGEKQGPGINRRLGRDRQRYRRKIVCHDRRCDHAEQRDRPGCRSHATSVIWIR